MYNTMLIVLLVLSPLLLLLGYLAGKGSVRNPTQRRRIEEYPFYPFVTNAHGIVEFSQSLFNEAVKYLGRKKNPLASKQLIIIGEQNMVRDILGSEDLNNYLTIYNRHDGQRLLSENDQFMENYKRIVTLIGKSFRGTGIEILLHNLVNPTKSVVAIENGEVTGRKVENGTTNLLLDLKTRKQNNQDKLNYGIQIGARSFKCTTIPIFRRDYGLVGAICINVDINFIRSEVMTRKEKLEKFIENIVKTDFQLDENILSKEEYTAALAGKRHYADDVLITGNTVNRNNRLMVIFFSDIANYSKLMGRDEGEAIRVLDENRRIHQESMARCNGTILKEIGDGILAVFNSASDAVQSAINIQRKVRERNNYQLRIGIHLGEVITSSNDIFGDGVNIASRIQSVALPETVCVSEVVYDNIKNKIKEEIIPIGDKMLKNIDGPVRLYEIKL